MVNSSYGFKYNYIRCRILPDVVVGTKMMKDKH